MIIKPISHPHTPLRQGWTTAHTFRHILQHQAHSKLSLPPAINSFSTAPQAIHSISLTTLKDTITLWIWTSTQLGRAGMMLSCNRSSSYHTTGVGSSQLLTLWIPGRCRINLQISQTCRMTVRCNKCKIINRLYLNSAKNDVASCIILWKYVFNNEAANQKDTSPESDSLKGCTAPQMKRLRLTLYVRTGVTRAGHIFFPSDRVT